MIDKNKIELKLLDIYHSDIDKIIKKLNFEDEEDFFSKEEIIKEMVSEMEDTHGLIGNVIDDDESPYGELLVLGVIEKLKMEIKL